MSDMQVIKAPKVNKTVKLQITCSAEDASRINAIVESERIPFSIWGLRILMREVERSEQEA